MRRLGALLLVEAAIIVSSLMLARFVDGIPTFVLFITAVTCATLAAVISYWERLVRLFAAARDAALRVAPAAMRSEAARWKADVWSDFLKPVLQSRLFWFIMIFMIAGAVYRLLFFWPGVVKLLDQSN